MAIICVWFLATGTDYKFTILEVINHGIRRDKKMFKNNRLSSVKMRKRFIRDENTEVSISRLFRMNQRFNIPQIFFLPKWEQVNILTVDKKFELQDR